MSLSVHVERVGDQFTIITVIPPRRFGVGPNLGAMQKALNLLTALNPDAFDPEPVADPATTVAHHATDAPMPPHVGEVIPSGIAEAMKRDIPLIDPEREDDTGDEYPDPRYAGTSCNIGGRCDE